jgi:hypothetical protein
MTRERREVESAGIVEVERDTAWNVNWTASQNDKRESGKYPDVEGAGKESSIALTSNLGRLPVMHGYGYDRGKERKRRQNRSYDDEGILFPATHLGLFPGSATKNC